MTPTEACEKFFEFNVQTGDPDGTLEDESESLTAKTREQFRLPALLIEEAMHGRPLATISQSDMVGLHSAFRQLHGKRFRNAPRHRTMTIQEATAHSVEGGGVLRAFGANKPEDIRDHAGRAHRCLGSPIIISDLRATQRILGSGPIKSLAEMAVG